jgi:3-oxoacyl-ACP reductase-like protein
MTIETLMQGLIDALNANTAALQNGGAKAAPAPAPAPKAEVPKPAPKPAAPAAKPAAPKPAAPDISEKMTKARELLKKVLDTKGSSEVRDMLARVGAAKLSEVNADTIDQLLENITAALNEGGDTGLFE